MDMKDQTFGVEVEMNHITREKVATVAAKFFGTNRVEDTANRNGYCTWSAWDARGREWKFSKDVSIVGPDAEKCEMVTPILKYEDMELLQELIRQLRHAGAQSDASRGCGVHIHIGANGQTPQSIRVLANLMAAHETLIAKALRLDTFRMDRYCRPIDPQFVRLLNAKKPTTMSELADVWYDANHANYGRTQHYNDSRYHMLNLHATFTKGTIEFRLFQFHRPVNGHRSGLHAGELKAYIQFCLAICHTAKMKKNASPTRVQMDNPKYAMTGWLCNMGLVGEEFKTLRKVFNDHLDGNAAKRYIA